MIQWLARYTTIPVLLAALLLSTAGLVTPSTEASPRDQAAPLPGAAATGTAATETTAATTNQELGTRNPDSASGTVAKITLHPPAGNVTLRGGESVVIRATLLDERGEPLPDDSHKTVNWAIASSAGSDVSSLMSPVTSIAGAQAKGAFGTCTPGTAQGEACTILAIPPGTPPTQTLTITAAVVSPGTGLVRASTTIHTSATGAQVRPIVQLQTATQPGSAQQGAVLAGQAPSTALNQVQSAKCKVQSEDACGSHLGFGLDAGTPAAASNAAPSGATPPLPLGEAAQRAGEGSGAPTTGGPSTAAAALTPTLSQGEREQGGALTSSASSAASASSASPASPASPASSSQARTLSQGAMEQQAGDGSTSPLSTPVEGRVNVQGAEGRAVAGGEVPLVPVPPGGFVFPILGRSPADVQLTGEFGGPQHRAPGFAGSLPARHTGVDLAIPRGTRLISPVDGAVKLAGEDDPAYGVSVVVADAHGFTHRLAHLSIAAVRPGDRVVAGALLGTSGNTGNSEGPHVHYEIRDPTGRPIDPTPLLSGQARTVTALDGITSPHTSLLPKGEGTSSPLPLGEAAQGAGEGSGASTTSGLSTAAAALTPALSQGEREQGGALTSPASSASSASSALSASSAAPASPASSSQARTLSQAAMDHQAGDGSTSPLSTQVQRGVNAPGAEGRAPGRGEVIPYIPPITEGIALLLALLSVTAGVAIWAVMLAPRQAWIVFKRPMRRAAVSFCWLMAFNIGFNTGGIELTSAFFSSVATVGSNSIATAAEFSPSALAAIVSGPGTVTLTWSAPAGGSWVTGYNVYRGTTPGALATGAAARGERCAPAPGAQAEFPLSTGVERGPGGEVCRVNARPVAGASFVDPGPLSQAAVYYYVVRAVRAGDVEVLVNSNEVAVLADRTPPAVVAAAPPAGATGAGTNTRVAIAFSKPMAIAQTRASFALRLCADNTAACATPEPAVVPVTATWTAANTALTMTPQALLVPNRWYQVSLDGAQDAGGLTMPAVAWTFRTGAGVDSIPPSVVSVSPARDATNVPLGADVVITFDKTMNAPATQTAASLCAAGGPCRADLAYTWNATGTQLTLAHPGGNLALTTVYRLVIGSRAADVSGNAIAVDGAACAGLDAGCAFAATFTTTSIDDTTPPAITGVSPANGATGVAAKANVAVAFSEPMSALATQGAAGLCVDAPGGACRTDLSFGWDAAATQLTIFHSGDLAASTRYRLKLTTAAKDLAGNPLPSGGIGCDTADTACAFASTFTTAAAGSAPPTVLSIAPAPGAANVAANTTIVIRFGEAMNPQATESGLSLCAVGGACRGDLAYAWNAPATTQLTVTTTAGLAGGTQYRVRLSTAAASVQGVRMAVPGQPNPACPAGDGDCAFASTFSTQYDAKTTLGTLGVTPASSGLTVNLPFAGDGNVDNSAIVVWSSAQATQNPQCVAGSAGTCHMVRGAAGFSYEIAELKPNTAYTISVTVSDVDGVAGTNPQTATVNTLSSALTGLVTGTTSTPSGAIAPRMGQGVTLAATLAPTAAAVRFQVKNGSTALADSGCRAGPAAGGGANASYTWNGRDGNGAGGFVSDGAYAWTAIAYSAANCGGGSEVVSNAVAVANAVAISLQPAPSTVVLAPGQSQVVTATAGNSSGRYVADGNGATVRWTAAGSASGDVSAWLSRTSASVGSSYPDCATTAGSGQACTRLTIPAGAAPQTITVTASASSQNAGGAAQTVAGSTTINDSPAAPAELTATTVDLTFRWKAPAPPAGARVAGYRLALGTQSGFYDAEIDVGNVTSYRYAAALPPGQTIFAVVRAYDGLGLLSGPSNEVRLAIPLTPTVPGTPIATACQPIDPAAAAPATVAGAPAGVVAGATAASTSTAGAATGATAAATEAATTSAGISTTSGTSTTSSTSSGSGTPPAGTTAVPCEPSGSSGAIAGTATPTPPGGVTPTLGGTPAASGTATVTTTVTATPPAPGSTATTTASPSGTAASTATTTPVTYNAASVELLPPPSILTLYPGESVVVKATLLDRAGRPLPDRASKTVSWSVGSSAGVDVSSSLSPRTSQIGAGGSGAYGTCATGANTGQACTVLAIPRNVSQAQTLTISASATNQDGSAVAGATTIYVKQLTPATPSATVAAGATPTAGATPSATTAATAIATSGAAPTTTASPGATAGAAPGATAAPAATAGAVPAATPAPAATAGAAPAATAASGATTGAAPSATAGPASTMTTAPGATTSAAPAATAGPAPTTTTAPSAVPAATAPASTAAPAATSSTNTSSTATAAPQVTRI